MLLNWFRTSQQQRELGPNPTKRRMTIDKPHSPHVGWLVGGAGRLTYPTVQFVREVDAFLDAAVAAATTLRQTRWRGCGGRCDRHWDVTHITGHLPKSRSNIWRSVGRHFWPTTSVNNTEYAARKAYKQFCLRSLFFFYCGRADVAASAHVNVCVYYKNASKQRNRAHKERIFQLSQRESNAKGFWMIEAVIAMLIH